jgi:hypothetical protein
MVPLLYLCLFEAFFHTVYAYYLGKNEYLVSYHLLSVALELSKIHFEGNLSLALSEDTVACYHLDDDEHVQILHLSHA